MRATRDGVAVLLHDATPGPDHRPHRRGPRAALGRGGAGPGAAAGSRSRGWTSCSARTRTLRVNIDVKTPAAVGPLVEAVRRAGAVDRVLRRLVLRPAGRRRCGPGSARGCAPASARAAVARGSRLALRLRRTAGAPACAPRCRRRRLRAGADPARPAAGDRPAVRRRRAPPRAAGARVDGRTTRPRWTGCSTSAWTGSCPTTRRGCARCWRSAGCGTAGGPREAGPVTAHGRRPADPADPAVADARRREQRGWYWYDWANSVFTTSVVTVFLGPYLTDVAETAAGGAGRHAAPAGHPGRTRTRCSRTCSRCPRCCRCWCCRWSARWPTGPARKRRAAGRLRLPRARWPPRRSRFVSGGRYLLGGAAVPGRQRLLRRVDRRLLLVPAGDRRPGRAGRGVLPRLGLRLPRRRAAARAQPGAVPQRRAGSG